MAQYSTALSHIFLAGTGIYCTKVLLHSNKLPYSHVPFGIVAFNSILGVWRWGNPTYGHKINKIYRLTSKLQDVLVLPCIVTSIWLKYNYSLNLASAHIIVSLVPLLLYLYDSRKNELVDAFLGGILLSLFVVSYFNSNYYGITTIVSYLLSYFVIKRGMIYNLPIEVPTQDLFNYSLCFFALFAVKAILEPLY